MKCPETAKFNHKTVSQHHEMPHSYQKLWLISQVVRLYSSSLKLCTMHIQMKINLFVGLQEAQNLMTNPWNRMYDKKLKSREHGAIVHLGSLLIPDLKKSIGY